MTDLLRAAGPRIFDMWQRGELSLAAAQALLVEGKVWALDAAARMGRRQLRSLPGVGERRLAEIERAAERYGLLLAD